MAQMDELVLRTVVFQFDGRVVEVFGFGDVIRYHVALLKEVRIEEPNRKGRSMVRVGGGIFSVDADELEVLRPFLAKVSAAMAEYRNRPGSGR
jgi:hypothetical protein